MFPVFIFIFRDWLINNCYLLVIIELRTSVLNVKLSSFWARQTCEMYYLLWITEQQPLFYQVISSVSTVVCVIFHCKSMCLPTSNVYISLLLKSMRMVIWKVETCRMCLRVSKPITWAPPTLTSEPSSYNWWDGQLNHDWQQLSTLHRPNFKKWVHANNAILCAYRFNSSVEDSVQICTAHVVLQCKLSAAVLSEVKSVKYKSRKMCPCQLMIHKEGEEPWSTYCKNTRNEECTEQK